MNSIFDKDFDRSLNHTRKWDKKLIKEKMGFYEDVIPMDIADLDFEVAPKIKEALLNVSLSGDYNYSYVYDDYYQSVIDWNKRKFNIDLRKEEIKLAFGTCSVLHYLVQCFCKKGDKVLINTPCYEPFILSVKRGDAIPVFNELEVKDNRYYINFEKLEKDIIENNIKMYILCSPQNPSGRIWTKEELQTIIDLCNKYNVILVSDEVHRDVIRKDKKFYSVLNLTDNVILCSSPNKSFNLGGLKGSYVIIKNKDIRNKFLEYLEKVYVTSPHVFMQAAHIAAYTKCDDWLDELNSYIDENFKYLYEFLDKEIPEIKVMKAEAGFLVWLNMKNIFKTENEMKEFFIKIKVLPVLGSYFSVSENDVWVRLNLGCKKETLIEVLNRIKSNL